jgi:tripartite ATP-independent transporter DctM subunit
MQTDVIAVLLLVGIFFFLLIIRTPIVFAIGFATLVTTWYLGLPLQLLLQNMVKGINTFTLLAVPFFIIAGEIMGTGGISKRLIALSNALVGWMRGGLAMVNIVASMFFGGISGSSAADTSSIGPILIPLMAEQGYDLDFATNVTMASSVQGILIPPSHNMVIYSLVAGSVSIGGLFLAGFVPGVFLGIALMVYSYIVSVKRNYPVSARFSLKRILVTFVDAIWGLLTVLIVVFGVISGVFTATESAAIAVLWATFVTFVIYREVPPSAIWGILGRSIKTLSIVMILIGTSAAFGWIVAYLKVPKMITEAILGATGNKIFILIILNLIMLFLGTLMDMSCIILIATPILLPIAMKIGLDPIHFGVIMILNLGIGLITPPVGSTLFIGSAISGVRIEKLSRALVPFYLVMIGVLIVITYIPAVSMTLPNLIMPK